MVDDFMVYVDRIISPSSLDSVNGVVERDGHGHDRGNTTTSSAPTPSSLITEGMRTDDDDGNGEEGGYSGKGDSSGEVRECRICQEEDKEHSLEAPCACNGTLKFAHRKCIQRWCDKKGDITCEICNKVFSPNYSLPPPRSSPDMMAIDIRQTWSSHISLQDPHLLALAAAEHQLLQSEYEDYVVANTGNVACLRSVAIILMVVMLVRQIMMLARDFWVVQDSSTFFDVSFLQLAGFLLPCYVLARSCYIIQSRLRRQG
ncbi:hypothetical protein Ancab_008353 [Ancistrocladus abbreviatus]